MLHRILIPLIIASFIPFTATAVTTKKSSRKVASESTIATPEPDWKFVEQQLKKHKFKKAFIAEMKKLYNPESFIDVINLNVLLFLRKSDYHGPQVTDDAAVTVRDFIRAHREPLEAAQTKYGVPPEAVVSLMWMETRLGNNLGAHHVPSVYLDLLQAQKKSVIAFLKTQTDKFATEKVTKKQIKEIGTRAKRKSEWALEELKAIQKIYLRKWDIGPSFTGSFAGAFGMPQFIPSSYVAWARAYKENVQPILSNPDDAIMSVAYYLKQSGWKSKSEKRKFNALLKYNNSKDYANAILDLARRTVDLKMVASEPAKAKPSTVPAEAIKPDQMKERVRGDSFSP